MARSTSVKTTSGSSVDGRARRAAPLPDLFPGRHARRLARTARHTGGAPRARAPATTGCTLHPLGYPRRRRHGVHQGGHRVRPLDPSRLERFGSMTGEGLLRLGEAMPIRPVSGLLPPPPPPPRRCRCRLVPTGAAGARQTPLVGGSTGGGGGARSGGGIPPAPPGGGAPPAGAPAPAR